MGSRGWRTVLIAAAMVGIAAAHVHASEWRKHWSVGPKPELRIRAGDAAVVVLGGDSTSIDASVTAEGWKIGQNGIQVIDHQTGNAVDIEIKVPSSEFGFGHRTIQLEVHVPRELTTDIHTGDGSIKLQNLQGSLRAETGDGSIVGINLEGEVSARSGDGSVHVEGRFDDLQLRTQDGPMELTVRSGSRLRSAWHLQTGDGSVRLRVPRSLSADLELRTGDGGIQIDLPLAGESKGAHETRGKLNGGGPTLSVRTGDGSISVSSS